MLKPKYEATINADDEMSIDSSRLILQFEKIYADQQTHQFKRLLYLNIFQDSLNFFHRNSNPTFSLNYFFEAFDPSNHIIYICINFNYLNHLLKFF